MDRKRVTNVLLNFGSFLHIWMSAGMADTFLHAYCLARAMDLSWGNRPSQELKIVPQNGKGKEACQRSCRMDNCQALEVSGSGLCKDHSWHIKNMFLWKCINFGVVCLNILIALLLIQSTLALTVSLMISILMYWDSVLVIVMDFINFITSRLERGIRKIFCKPNHEYKMLPT